MKVVLFCATLLVAGCVHTSPRLPTEPAHITAIFDASEEAIYFVTQRVLVREGYPLAQTNRATGTISTEPQRVDLSGEQVDCEDAVRGRAAVLSFDARVAGNRLWLWINLEAKGCVSKGELERGLVEKIRAELGS